MTMSYQGGNAPYQAAGPNKMVRFAILGGIIVFALGVILFGISLLGGSGGGNKKLARAINRQGEIIAIVEEFGGKSADQDLANQNARILVLLATHTTTLQQYDGTKLSAEELPVQTSTINERLQKATQGTRFDQELETTLTDLLETNITELESALPLSKNIDYQEDLAQIISDQKTLIP